MFVENVLGLVGSTPCVKLREMAPEGADVWVKLEKANPAGSAKDRAALSMVRDAEERGLLKEGSVIVEPTSGNTGVALSFVAAVLGYRCVIVMPESMSLERRRLVKALGAELVLTPASEGMAGAIRKAEELRDENGWFMPDQFDNPANPLAHYRSTGPEIWDDFGDSLDYFVAAAGSGGTVSGVGRYMKEKGMKAKVVAVEPSASPVLSGGAKGPHKIQGIGAGFVPGCYDASVVDQVVTVTDGEAFEATRRLAREEGILVGISSGAALAGALKVVGKGKRALVLLCDTGERYLSEPFWEEDGV